MRVRIPNLVFNGARRYASTSQAANAQDAVQELLTRYTPGSVISTRSQLLDANQAQQLATTLVQKPSQESSSVHTIKDGDALPPGHHLVYFTPSIIEFKLASDGTDKTVNPLAPFTRRMWAGGEMKWSQKPEQRLRIGQMVKETTRMLSAEAKSKKGVAKGDMVVVGIEKTYETEAGTALVDRRNWIFQRERSSTEPPSLAARPTEVPFPNATISRDLIQTPVSLFRFSALTFNAHKIHYSLPFNREVEGHRGLVVHGPLNLINILELWRSAYAKNDSGACPGSIAYRAKAPVYAEELYRIILEKGSEGASSAQANIEASIVDAYGKVAMSATIA
ncbi:hypothetical protein ANO11243_042710 [Dothideomycetidae sp. 11243]|nr:hypothetical protein ANO11243_042710 [fungal sp. No.11243]